MTPARAVSVWLLVVSAPLVAPVAGCGSTHDAGGGPDANDASVPSLLAPCALQPTGNPEELFVLAGRHLSAPSMVVLDPGDATGGVTAKVAMQGFANGSSEVPDDIELLQVHVGEPWPEGVGIDVPAHLVGEFATGWAEMASAPSGRAAVAWHRDTTGVGRPQFRAIDPNGVPGDDVTLADKGGAVLSLVEGASAGAEGFSGAGYGVIWRDHNAPGVGPVRPMVAVLDGSGETALGPFAIAGPEDYPGRSPTVGWTGSAYVVAIPFDDCHFGDTICVADSIVLAGLHAGPTNDDSGLFGIAAIPALRAEAAPTSATVASWQGRTWLVWAEATEHGRIERTVRAVRLGGDGTPAAEPILVADDVPLLSTISLSVSAFGPVLAWAEEGDSRAGSKEGASFVVVQQLDHEGAPVAGPIRVPSTAVDTYGPPTTVALGSPDTLLLLWSAHGAQADGPNAGWLARLDCPTR